MQKTKLVLLSTAVLMLSACGSPKDVAKKTTPKADPQEVISEMINQTQDLKSGAFSLSGSVFREDKTVGMSVEADFTVAGKHEENDEGVPNLDLNFDLEIDTTDPDKGTMVGSAGFNVRLVNAMPYLKLNEVTLPDDPEIKMVEGFIGAYMNNWYTLPEEMMPEDIKEQMIDQTRKEQVKEIMSKAKLFVVANSSTADGQYVYETTLDKEGLKDLSKEMSKLDGLVVTDEDLAMFDEFFDNYTHSITLYINGDTKNLDKATLTLNSNNLEDQMDVNLEIAISDHNQAQSIVAPEDAEDFNPMALMGMGAMIESSQGTSLNEDTAGMGGLETMDVEDFEASMDQLDADLEEMSAGIEETMEDFNADLEAQMDQLNADLEEMGAGMEEAMGVE